MLKNNYYSSLDFFRGFCGYGVAITHLFAFNFGSKIMEYTSFLFVEFFFVLSGFVLYPQLIKTLNNKENLLIFYKRRWLRTLPLYILSIILISILTKNIFTVDFLKYFFFIQDLFPNFLENNYYPVVWSLSVEEFFYLLFPILLIFLDKNNFIKILLFLLILFWLFKIFIFLKLNLNFYRTGTVVRFDAILIGFIVAHFKNFILPRKNFFIFLMIISILLYYLNKNLILNNTDLNWIKFIFISLLQLISVCTLLFFISINNIFINARVKKFSLLISRQTYSIYLIHMILLYIIKGFNLDPFILTIFYILTLVILSSLIYLFIEKPILEIRPKFK